MNRSSMSKQMMQEGGKVKPKKKLSTSAAAEKKFNEELLVRRANEGAKSKAAEKAPKPVQGAGNMPLSDAEAAKQVEILKAQNKDKKVKKMNRGGMTQQERGRRGNPPPQRKPNPKMLQVDTPRMEDAPPGMARGGMTKRMMGASNAPESGPTKPMVSPKPKPKGPAPYDDSDPKPRKMKSGGKVRGYGMARGGKACKMR
jgi:hypothetical protein